MEFVWGQYSALFQTGTVLRGEAVEDARLNIYLDRVDKSSFQPTH